MSPSVWAPPTWSAAAKRCAAWTMSSPRPSTPWSPLRNRATGSSSHITAPAASPRPVLDQARRSRSAPARSCKFSRPTSFYSSSLLALLLTDSSPSILPRDPITSLVAFVGLLVCSPCMYHFTASWTKLEMTCGKKRYHFWRVETLCALDSWFSLVLEAV